jgi:hypothetical protein
MRAVLLGFAAVLIALPAYAGTASKGCSFSGTAAGTAGTAVGGGASSMALAANETWCYRYVNADATTTIIGPLRITAPSALITFDPDLFQTVVTTARLIPHFCPQGAAVDTTSAATIFRSCPSMGGANGAASLDGTEGTATTQNASIRVGPGAYYFEISVVCEAGDTCQIAAQAEGEGAH